MLLFSEGVGELWEGDQRLGRVRFQLSYPKRVEPLPEGKTDIAEGYVESVDGDIDLSSLATRAADLALRFEGHSLRCMVCLDGLLEGFGGWKLDRPSEK